MGATKSRAQFAIRKPLFFSENVFISPGRGARLRCLAAVAMAKHEAEPVFRYRVRSKAHREQVALAFLVVWREKCATINHRFTRKHSRGSSNALNFDGFGFGNKTNTHMNNGKNPNSLSITLELHNAAAFSCEWLIFAGFDKSGRRAQFTATELWPITAVDPHWAPLIIRMSFAKVY